MVDEIGLRTSRKVRIVGLEEDRETWLPDYQGEVRLQQGQRVELQEKII